MLNRVMRLFHSLLSLTPASGITERQCNPERRCCTRLLNLLWEKWGSTWPAVLHQNYEQNNCKITASRDSFTTTQLARALLFFLISHLCEYAQ